MTSLNFLDQALMSQANRKVVSNPIGGMCTYIIRDFLRMNPLELVDTRRKIKIGSYMRLIKLFVLWIDFYGESRASHLPIERCSSCLV